MSGMSEERVWHLNTAAGQEGPLTADEVRARRASGAVGDANLVWRQGLAGWQRLGDTPELAVAGAPPPLSAAPTPAPTPVMAPPAAAARPAGPSPSAVRLPPATAKKGGNRTLVIVVVAVVAAAAGAYAVQSGIFGGAASTRPAPEPAAEPAPEGEEVAYAEDASAYVSDESPPVAAGDSTTPVDTAAAAAGQVVVTRIVRRGEVMEITLNGALVVKGVTIRSGSSGEFLAFPSENRDGDFFPYVRAPREAMAALLAQVKENRPVDTPIGFARVEVERLHRLSGDGATQAFVSFTLDGGAVRLSSWRLVKKRAGGLFLSPPSEKRGEEWDEYVFASDRDLRAELERVAMEALAASP